MRTGLLLALLAIPFAACGTTKDYKMRFHGKDDLNPNSANSATPVKGKVFTLKGGDATSRLESEPIDDLWAGKSELLAKTVSGIAQEFSLAPNSEIPPLEFHNVADDVTHFLVIARFHTPEAGKDRCLIPRAKLPDVDIWL
ncbi:MAG TPA: type VI secretion system lipoprotein TssJ, partial [Planctomycetota bacterium]|nr:type VI secretion system lipoprotein TssJ [Planctomycetota bacterium]